MGDRSGSPNGSHRKRSDGLRLITGGEAWRGDAECARLVRAGRADIRWWHTDEGSKRGRDPRGVRLTADNRHAVRICAEDCPVRQDCLNSALGQPAYLDQRTIWGGLTSTARDRIRRGRSTIEAEILALAQSLEPDD